MATSSKKLAGERQRQLIEDIVNARHDLLSLAQAHNLTPQQLGTWIQEPANHQLLSGLCLLADLETQLLLSRFRLVAAERLFKLATEDGQGDIARRACVDLLKLDLKRDVPQASEDESHDALPSATALYGKSDTDNQPSNDQQRMGIDEVQG